ncbi:MAG: Fe-S cluster assembly protein SufD [Anaerolineae bacterium]|nr:Fe-S cluster assembly protein SufD [Anaerolineae bacterium]
MVAVRRRTTGVVAPNYTLADVHAVSDQNQDPQWLRQLRESSWGIYESLPMPTLQDEAWRRTNYQSIRWGEAEKRIPANGANLTMVPEYRLEPLVGEGDGGRMVFVDGKLVDYTFPDDVQAEGVIFADLISASKSHENLVRPNLMQKAVLPSDGKFAALHGALWNYGAFLYIPRNKAIEAPFHIVIYNTHSGANFGHVLVVLEENAQATVQVEYASADTSEHATYIGVTELLVGDGANLKYVALQDWNRNTYEFSHQRARVGRDANLDWIIGTMGSKLTKAQLEIEIDGIGSNARMSGFFFADKDQLFDLDTQQNHNAPRTVSDLLFKGAAKDNARTVWQGMIKSLPDMQKIDGYQVCRNLILDKNVRMDAIPGLEIEADDVKCSHAATFGTLEEHIIFYLMSRGITRPQAQLMVIDGFFDELLQRVPFERVRERLQQAIESKILGE